jgi:hypothetical protein
VFVVGQDNSAQQDFLSCKEDIDMSAAFDLSDELKQRLVFGLSVSIEDSIEQNCLQL